MSSPQPGPDLDPVSESESAQRTGPETSSIDEPALQPDSAKFKDVPATPHSQRKTDSESHDGARNSEHHEATVQQTVTKDNETSTHINSPLSTVQGPLTPQTSPQGLNSQSLLISPTSLPKSETLDSLANPQKDLLKTSDASLALCEARELTMSNPQEIVDLTQDGPYNGPRAIDIGVVKQEPHDVLSIAESITAEQQQIDIPEQQHIERIPEPTGLDAMDIDAPPSYVLPELKGKDLQSDPEDMAEEIEDTLAILKTAGENFRASLPIKKPPHPTTTAKNLDIDSDAEDAMAATNFERKKEGFLRKKQTGKLDMADEVEYRRARQAESDRKRRRARNHTHRASPELDDQSLFISNDDQRSPSASSEVEVLMNYEVSKPAQPPLARKSNSKGRGRPRGSKTVAKGGISKTTSNTNGRQGPSTMNFGSLFHNDIIAIAQENQRKENQPIFTSKNKAKALSELISSMPEEQQKVHGIDLKELNLATKKFTGWGSMKADGAGKWKLKGMRSSLHHYQLLGAAFMRDLERVSIASGLSTTNANEH